MIYLVAFIIHLFIACLVYSLLSEYILHRSEQAYIEFRVDHQPITFFIVFVVTGVIVYPTLYNLGFFSYEYVM